MEKVKITALAISSLFPLWEDEWFCGVVAERLHGACVLCGLALARSLARSLARVRASNE